MEASEKASVAFGKAPRRIIYTFCNLQSCCKAKMLPNYTSLLKKFSNFPHALTGTIFLLLLTNGGIGKAQEEWYLRYVTCCMTEKKYLALFKVLITVGLLFTWILQYRLSIPEKLKAKQLYKNFVLDLYVFWVINKFVSTAYDKKFKISISCSSFSVYYVKFNRPISRGKRQAGKHWASRNSQVEANALTMLNKSFYKRSRR